MSETIVPETLLALAKDDRYLRKCSELLSRVLNSVGLEHHGSVSGWALLLYSLLVVKRTNQTLGMEFMGLKSIASNHALWRTMAIVGLLKVALNYSQNNGLRGQERIRFHQEQRRAMLARSSGVDVQSTTSYWKRITEFLQKTMVELSNIDESPGPHAVLSSSTTSIASWIVKLHLAHYCWTGKWPSFWFTGVSKLSSTRSNTIANKPDTHRWVAVMIGLQAAGGALAWITNHIPHQDQANTVVSPTDIELSSSSSSSLCFICRLPRISPAAASSCGHVFCWNCLYQWTTKKQECPLCRSPCRPQDIIALYNYEPSVATHE